MHLLRFSQFQRKQTKHFRFTSKQRRFVSAAITCSISCDHVISACLFAEQIGFMENAPHHGADDNVLSSEEDDREPPRPFHIPLRPSLEPGHRPVHVADPYSVSNAAPNFLDLFTTSTAPPVSLHFNYSPLTLRVMTKFRPYFLQKAEGVKPPSYTSRKVGRFAFCCYLISVSFL